MLKRINELIEKYENFDPCNIGDNEKEDQVVLDTIKEFLFDLEELKKLIEG